ncbi:MULTISPECIES: aminoglycoside phosphotransferase family protein [unclassified Beijerinckia]|uniref:aminoglycoside phosphotransferase family protein n=1 Tax=unclassified Beijerinckia TaxID=2638183 RepID=UPI00089A4EDF|nr:MULTISPECIES: aminoglycoside phosphotransferase family protein [unclassified Beijerinckia]MDH7795454.1 streptomycin 6-kinase [Beijerinckia sp. GAS462]SEC02260.1 streptomycin 6-kinase [Beijerinckia sp. 28-YEA-48]
MIRPKADYDFYLDLWRLRADGEAFSTHSSDLMPVRDSEGRPAMLKLPIEKYEKAGSILMQFWDGEGTARVLGFHDGALLLERPEGVLRPLSQLVQEGRDDEATQIICEAIAVLHRPRPAARLEQLRPQLVALEPWFKDLVPAPEKYGEPFGRSLAIAQELLATQTEIVPLHGDIHHDNIIDFGARGWLVIDPKPLIGDSAFDYANLFCNPNLETATDPQLFKARLARVCAQSGIERQRMLRWLIAWTGLSAVWFLEDHQSDDIDMGVMQLALAELN